MTNPIENMPPDPFMLEGMAQLTTSLTALYMGLIQAGMPENRAYDFVRDYFISQADKLQA